MSADAFPFTEIEYPDSGHRCASGQTGSAVAGGAIRMRGADIRERIGMTSIKILIGLNRV